MIVDVEAGVERLRRGDVVAYPTETVYGLGVDATQAPALELLRRLKGRSQESGLSVLVPDLAALDAWVSDVPAAARRLAERFWPGPLTLVLETEAAELALVRTPDGVGFRCSSQPTARALALLLGRPIVSTSCNRSGESPCRDAACVAERFGPALAVVGGEPAGGLPPSSVAAVSARGDLRLLREGALPRQALEEALRT